VGIVFGGLPDKLTMYLQQHFDLRSLVETGTLTGSNAVWASKHFKKVYSIELSEQHWASARANHSVHTNIEFLLGSSATVMAGLVPRVDRPLFWLDAHWSGGDTAGVENECPLLEEIDMIARSGAEPKVILIDDARLFLTPPPPPHRWNHWPDLGAVVVALGRCGDMYITVKDDVIIAAPAAARADLVAFWRGQPWSTTYPLQRWRRRLGDRLRRRRFPGQSDMPRANRPEET
jgi:hypothetical protein